MTFKGGRTASRFVSRRKKGERTKVNVLKERDPVMLFSERKGTASTSQIARRGGRKTTVRPLTLVGKKEGSRERQSARYFFYRRKKGKNRPSHRLLYRTRRKKRTHTSMRWKEREKGGADHLRKTVFNAKGKKVDAVYLDGGKRESGLPW